MRVVPVAGVSYRADVLPDAVVRPGPAAGARAGAGQRARPERRRDLERGADAAARLRAARGRGRADGRRAGRLALARRGRTARADRSPRRLGRPAPIDSAAVAYEFKLPDLGEGLTEGEIARWLVAEGQEIAEDDPLVEVQTDKTTVEIPSPAGGQGRADPGRRGRRRPVGTVLVVIGEDGAAAVAGRAGRSGQSRDSPGTVTGARSGRVRATPLIRRMAQELGVDLETVRGHGAAGPDHRGRRARGRRRRNDRPRAGASRCAASAASSPST